MNTVHVNASGSYDIVIGQGLLPSIGERVKVFDKVTKITVVSDDNVYPLYGDIVKNSLEAAGFEVSIFVFPHGEHSKCLKTYGELLEFMDEKHLSRSDMIAALGGGVTGDLAGFAAATYQRGIKFVQIPTSLLAMVDSSVGGKTAVDLSHSKNQVGAFWQPSLVLIDTDVLQTLPDAEYRCGCSEIIKYGVLGNRTLFDECLKTPIKDQAEHIITTCVSMKRDTVEQDEFDRGERMKLNLGHTLGHVAEALSDFKTLHGQAVAMGMAAITRIAVKQGVCSEETLNELLNILNVYELPTDMPYTADQMVDIMLTDKKVAGGTLRVIIPEEIGVCRIDSVPAADLKNWLISGGIHE